MMQSVEQEVPLEAITSISGIVRKIETSTKRFIPYLEFQEQICMWEQECIRCLISIIHMHLPMVCFQHILIRNGNFSTEMGMLTQV